MAGRWKLLAWGGLCAAAVGCNRTAVNPPAPAGLAPAGGKPSLLQSAFGSNPKFAPAPPDVVTVRERRPAGEGLKPETEVTLAGTEVDAAFDPSRSGVERDALLDSARQRYQGVLEKSPGHKGALLGLARMYGKVGDTERSMAAYQDAVRANPADHSLLYQMATAQARFGDFAGAAESCRRALAADPQNRTYGKTLGYCQARLGRWDEAFESLRQSMPEADARYFIARALLDQDKPEDGRRQLELAVQANPQFGPAQVMLATMNGGPAPDPAAPPGAVAGDGSGGGVVPVGYTEPVPDPK